jgi:hypothetical protein
MDGDIIAAIVEEDKEFSHSLALHRTAYSGAPVSFGVRCQGSVDIPTYA